MAEDNDTKLLLFFMTGLTVFFLAMIFFNLAVKDETGFTEVYLQGNASTAIINKPFNVQFVIHSHETQAGQYDYTVTGQQTVTGSLELQPDEKQVVQEAMFFSQAKENQRVFIEVKNE